MERVEIRHYNHSNDREVVTVGLTAEQRRAVEEAVLPPMPESLSVGSGRGDDACVAVGRCGSEILLEAGKGVAFLRTGIARKLGQRMIEFADAIEARKGRN